MYHNTKTYSQIIPGVASKDNFKNNVDIEVLQVKADILVIKTQYTQYTPLPITLYWQHSALMYSPSYRLNALMF